MHNYYLKKMSTTIMTNHDENVKILISSSPNWSTSTQNTRQSNLKLSVKAFVLAHAASVWIDNWIVILTRQKLISYRASRNAANSAAPCVSIKSRATHEWETDTFVVFTTYGPMRGARRRENRVDFFMVRRVTEQALYFSRGIRKLASK